MKTNRIKFTPTRAVVVCAAVVFGYFTLLGGTFAQDQFAIGNEVLLSNSVIHPDGPVPPEVLYCFDNSGLHAMSRDPNASVIIHHGRPQDIAGFRKIYSHTEQLPFYIPSATGVKELTLSQIAGILRGEFQNWSEVGGVNMAINIYAPQQLLKADAIKAQMARNGITINVEPHKMENYRALASVLENDPGALVLGLRSAVASQENLQDVIRIDPAGDDDRPAFAMPIIMYVRENDRKAEEIAAQLLEMVQKRASADRMVYPLKERKELMRLSD